MLTAAQIDGYREKLKSNEYMEAAVNGVAEKFMKGTVVRRNIKPKNNKPEVKVMARNKLSDLNDHLMAQIEWLTDRDVKGEELTEEIRRSEAVSKVATQVIANANLILKSCVAVENSPSGKMKLPFMIEDKT